MINFDETNVMDTASDYIGYTYVQGGNSTLQPPPTCRMDTSQTADSAEILSSSGAVGLDTGLFDGAGVPTASWDHVPETRQQLSESEFAQFAGLDLLRLYGVRDVITNRFDSGGLMLGEGDYNKNLNFSGSQGTNPLARAANMSLAAHEGGSTYTGTITPAACSERQRNSRR